MPFPWKKVKSTRISQFVNDHLHHSQRRRDGSSLVVETGFPTSLVDLFMKNREKLKKSSKKKHQIPLISHLSDDDDPRISLIAASPSPPTSSPLSCPSPVQRRVDEIHVVGSIDGAAFVGIDEREEQGVERVTVDVNSILLVVLKLFIVVVLALGTKRLTVGVTISAFLLLLMEYVGKHVCPLLKPCLDIERVLSPILQSVCRFLMLDEKSSVVLKPQLQQEHSIKTGSSLKSYGSRCLDQEIQIVQPEMEVMDESGLNGRLDHQETNLQEVELEKDEPVYKVAESKRKSRRAKIKSKMKKIFRKKSRTLRKEDNRLIEEDGSILCDEDEAEDSESEHGSELLSVSSRRFKHEDGKITNCPSGGLSEMIEDLDTKKVEKCNEIEGGLTWRYLTLNLIVLIGLIGGRGFALLLTLSWLLLLPRYKKLPIIRSFNDKSS